MIVTHKGQRSSRTAVKVGTAMEAVRYAIRCEEIGSAKSAMDFLRDWMKNDVSRWMGYQAFLKEIRRGK